MRPARPLPFGFAGAGWRWRCSAWEWNKHSRRLAPYRPARACKRSPAGYCEHALLVIEIGAGLLVPTVRRFAENCGGRLIRINPDEAAVPPGGHALALPLGGLAGIASLHAALTGR